MASLFRLLDFCVVSATRSKSGSSLNFRRIWETVLWLMDQSKDRSNLLHILEVVYRRNSLHTIELALIDSESYFVVGICTAERALHLLALKQW